MASTYVDVSKKNNSLFHILINREAKSYWFLEDIEVLGHRKWSYRVHEMRWLRRHIWEYEATLTSQLVTGTTTECDDGVSRLEHATATDPSGSSTATEGGLSSTDTTDVSGTPSVVVDPFQRRHYPLFDGENRYRHQNSQHHHHHWFGILPATSSIPWDKWWFLHSRNDLR